jgi:hypothetical protein
VLAGRYSKKSPLNAEIHKASGSLLEQQTVCWSNEVHELATSSVAARGAARAAPTREGLERSGCKLIGVLAVTANAR